ncbi:AAA family ATPase [Advenella mimigardefordensis]|uniref:AAA family ATPase n=1 Tax=Advenella mimigardefordensis TaxID=302406 RepID=UPI000A05505C|nr:AAA family ATPase [Advenella mimigardefordensis]
MKILRFKASKVHGQYNFDLNFFSGITFLIGINGSGKTTALRLMQAALTIDLSTLTSIKFQKLTIDVLHQDKLFNLEIINAGSNLIFILNGEESSVKIPFSGNDDRNSILKSERLDSFFGRAAYSSTQ